MWRETIKLRLAWSLLFILRGKFSAMANHCAVEHDLQKYSRALRASLPLLYWKIMGPYPIKNCIKSRKYYMHFRGICVMKAFLPVQMLSAAPGLRLRTAACCHLPPFRCYTTHTHIHTQIHTSASSEKQWKQILAEIQKQGCDMCVDSLFIISYLYSYSCIVNINIKIITS